MRPHKGRSTRARAPGALWRLHRPIAQLAARCTPGAAYCGAGVSIVPVVGSTYQLIASGVYYTLEKPNNAKERLIDGAVRLTADVISIATVGASKSAPTVIFKELLVKNHRK